MFKESKYESFLLTVFSLGISVFSIFYGMPWLFMVPIYMASYGIITYWGISMFDYEYPEDAGSKLNNTLLTLVNVIVICVLVGRFDSVFIDVVCFMALFLLNQEILRVFSETHNYNWKRIYGED